MKTNIRLALLVLIAVPSFAIAQQSRPQQPDKPVLFAVLNNGGTLEPIAYVENKKLESAVDGAEDAAVLAAFHKRYFKAKTSYQLIFGGAKAGMVLIKGSNPETECSRHTAEVITSSARAKLKGNVMALASSQSLNVSGSGVRRLPPPSERREIESLVKDDFAGRKIPTAILKQLN